MSSEPDVLIAIDPGKGGGIAVKSKLNHHHDAVYKMPVNIYDTINFFNSSPFTCGTYTVTCVIEKLNAGSVSYGRMKSSKTIWSQAENYTALMCGLYSAGITTIEVSPAKWMGKLPGTRPKEYKDRKQWLKQHAQRLYPQEKVTLWNADALCLLHVAKEFI